MRGWEEIEDFANARREFFAGRLDLSNGIPSHDTINRFFQAIDRDTFARCFMKWTASIAEEVEHRTVCIDLCVKANQPTLMEDIARYFDSHPGLNSLVLNECDHGTEQ